MPARTLLIVIAALALWTGCTTAARTVDPATVPPVTTTATSPAAAPTPTAAPSPTTTSSTATTVAATTTTATTTPSTPSTPSTTATPSTPTASGSTVVLRPAAEPIGTVLHGSLVVDGRERTYRLYVPSELPDGPVPLLIALHGGTGWADQFAQTDHVESLAESNGFLVVHPDGIAMLSGRGQVWNGGICCGVAARDAVDDVHFIEVLVDRLESEHDIDPGRIAAFGHSNGAILSYRLACELSDRITAIGLYAGTLGVTPCAPPVPVSVLHLHGDADANIPIDGGVGSVSIAGVDFPPPHDGFEALADADGCPAATIRVEGDLTTEDRSPCDGGADARFDTIATATHAWPGGTTRIAPASGAAYTGLDATAVIVEFLLSHPRP